MDLLHQLHKIVFTVDKAADEILTKNINLTFSQFLILIAVTFKPKCSQKDIAKFLNVTEAAISRQILLLEKQGYITIYINKENRRENIITITKLGTKKRTQAEKLLGRESLDYFKDFTKSEAKQFHKLSEKFLKNVLDQYCKFEKNSKKDN